MLLASPYVSDRAFEAAFNRTVSLDSWHLAQVLLQNSPLNAYVQRLLTESDIEPFYRDLVLGNQGTGISHKDLLIADMYYFGGKVQEGIGQYYNRVSTNIDPNASLQQLQELVQEADHRLEIIKPYVDQAINSNTNVDQALGNISNDSLTTEYINQHLVARTLLGTSQYLQNPEIIDAKSMQDLSNQYLSGSSIARAVQYRLDGTTTDEFIRFPGEPKNLELFSPSPQEQHWSYPVVEVNPNPTNGWFTYRFKAPESVENVKIITSDPTGRTISTDSWNTNIAANDVDLSNNPVGVYIITMFWDDVKVAATKVVHVK